MGRRPSLLFQVTPTDFSVYADVALLLGGVGLVAAVVPARRASKVDPVTSLRRSSFPLPTKAGFPSEEGRLENWDDRGARSTACWPAAIAGGCGAARRGYSRRGLPPDSSFLGRCPSRKQQALSVVRPVQPVVDFNVFNRLLKSVANRLLENSVEFGYGRQTISGTAPIARHWSTKPDNSQRTCTAS